MNISRILKICIFCCVVCMSINCNISNSATANNVPEETYLYTAIHNDLFKHNAKLYNNNIIFDIDGSQISIDRTGRYHSSDSFDEKKEFGKLQLEKFNNLKQLLGKDFITYIKEDVKEIFGNNYEVYFNYLDLDYNGRRKVQYTINNTTKHIYTERFNGTFEELMKVNEYQLITTIHYNLQFMKNKWYSNSHPKNLIITDNNVMYYFDIDNNKILVYSKPKQQKSWNESESVLVQFISKFNKRWENEQIAIHKVFGNDYKIYYRSLDIDYIEYK